ncbi:unnamed protein product [Adineta steineri]|uniref:ARC105/Med15 mediator subunit C-terminal domain-containing protein n=1 Tax=Adineta steineri TaxID=433720 RepID=A0A818GNJ0_9BILA|nr:unnamed protein product [Adineta steineri]
MMTDTAAQQLIDTNGQPLVTQQERQAMVNKLSTHWTQDLSTRVENMAFEKSGGRKPLYLKAVQNYYQHIQTAYQNRSNQQQQQQQQQTLQSLNNNNNNNSVQYLNQQVNSSQQQQQPSITMISQPQLAQMLNQQNRFNPVQPSLPSRMPNPQTSMMNTQSPIPNQGPRLREPQKFNQSTLNSTTYTVSPHNSASSPLIPTNDLSSNYATPQQQQQSQLTNINLSDYLSQQNRYVNPRARTATSLNGNFPQQTSSNNSNDVLHQFIAGNSSTNSVTSSSASSPINTPMTNTSSTGDRLLQRILTSNPDGTSNTMSLTNRQSTLQQPTPSNMPQPNRSVNPTNSNNPLRPSLLSQQPSPSSSVILMPTVPQISNVQIQPSSNVTIQQSSLNNNNNNNVNGSFASRIQAMQQLPSSVTMNSSTPLQNNYSSPVDRSAPLSGSGSISSPDEETINLIKYFKENLGKLQLYCQKYTNEGNQNKARNLQLLYEQMVQFINNPTYESLPNAKNLRDSLERASNRSQQPNAVPVNVPVPNPPTQQINDINQFEKSFTEFLSRDQKKRLFFSKLFIEPLNNVINGIPHKKVRLDNDYNNSNRITQQIIPSNQSSLISQLNDEFNLLPANIFSIELLPVSHVVKTIQLNDEYLSRKGLVLRCKLLEPFIPIIQPLRIKISTRYPDEQPEILSLTKTMPPKLEFTDGHPYFEQISMLFISYLFKLPPQHTVTDILNIWRQSVQAAL